MTGRVIIAALLVAPGALFTFPAVAVACDAPAHGESCRVLALGAAYVGDVWRNARGGLQTGNAYLDKLDLYATLNGAPALGLDGVTVHGHLQHANRTDFSGRYTGDLQVISNIDGVSSWRIYELWTEMKFGVNSRYGLKAGLYDLNSEFDKIDPATLFVNSSHGVGADIGQTGMNGPSIFPITALALRLRADRGGAYGQVAAIDAVPGRRNNPTRTGFHLSSDEGALLIAEAGFANARRGRAALGAWRYTAAFDQVSEHSRDASLLRRKGNQGVYFSGTQVLYEQGARRFVGWVRVGSAADAFNVFSGYTGGGFTASGLFASRPDDQWGVAIAAAHTGRSWRTFQREVGAEPTSQEIIVEVTWRAPLTDRLTIQPDLQLVRHPGADKSLSDALAVGLRVEFATGSAH